MDNTIKFDKDTPVITNASNVQSVMGVDRVTGLVGNVALDLITSEVADQVMIDSISLEPIPSGALPTPELGVKRKMEVTGNGTWTHATLPPGGVSLTDDEKGLFWFNGSAWSLKNVQSTKGERGDDGASLLKPWSTISADYPYGQNIQVRHDGKTYVSLITANVAEPGTDKTKWLPVGGSGGEEGNTDNVFEIVSEDGSVHAYVDGKGKFRAEYPEGSVPKGAVNGLVAELKEIDTLGNKEIESDNIIEFTSPGRTDVYGFLDSKGVWNFPKMRVNSLEGYESSEGKGQGSVTGGVTTKEEIYLPDMPFFNLNIEGVMPAGQFDTNKAIATLIDATGSEVIKFNAELSRQGAASIAWAKANMTIDLFNDKMDGVNLKFGYLCPDDSFHLKGYWSDTMHVRDISAGILWNQTLQSRPYPSNLFVNLDRPVQTEYDDKIINVEAEAKYTHIGYRCAVYLYGEFYGLYTWRQKKTRENYSINRDNPNHILIDSQILNVGLGGKNYPDFASVEIDYEFRSPRNLTQPVQDNTMRFFDWARAVFLGTTNIRNTYSDYLDLPAWIDYIIICEAINNIDSVTNNAMYVTYDGLIWKPLLIDTDRSIGVQQSGLIPSTILPVITSQLHGVIKTEFLPEIKERYAELRSDGTLSMSNFKDIYSRPMINVPLEVYKMDFEKWGAFTMDVTTNKGIPDMIHLLQYLKVRIDTLDSWWLV